MTYYSPTPEETITSTSTIDNRWLTVQDKSLLEMYETVTKSADEQQKFAGRIEQEIHRRIAARGATGIPSETFECEVVTTFTYDQATLTPLLEMLNDVELAKCYEPAYTPEPVEVPAKWRIQQLLAVARRRGTEAMEIVERAKVETGRRLKFKRRESP